jgi:hypothetical protein
MRAFASRSTLQALWGPSATGCVPVEYSAMIRKLTSKAISQRNLFGPPPILEGEDAATYDELLGRVCAAIKPVDVIDEILIADAVALEWEILRWRRLKLSLIQACVAEALERFLSKGENLDYNQYRKEFVDKLTKVLQDNRAEDQTEDFALTLARACGRAETDAVDKVKEWLAGIDLELVDIMDEAQARKARELVQGYVRRELSTVKLVDRLLARASKSIEVFTAEALADELDNIERIDRSPLSRRAAAIRACARSIGVGPPLAKHCVGGCNRSRPTTLK